MEALLQFVSYGLGVAIVPAALVASSKYSSQLHVLTIKKDGFSLPTWRIVIVTRAQKLHPPGKTIVQLFLETLSEI